MPYALPNAYALARERLELLAACNDPASIRRASALGVAPGWRCLDVGAGAGSFARWLAGVTGDTVAADLDVRLLSSGPGLEVRQLDVRTDLLERGAFDLVHTRHLLLHLPERAAVLPRLVDALRPGGVLLIEEDDIHPVLTTATGDYRAAWLEFLAMMQDAGTDARWARDLPGMLDSLGLDSVEAELSGQLFRGGSVPARFWSLTWLQARDRLDAEVVDAGREALADPALWFHGPVRVIAWGYAPGAAA
jgi:SAM-dependent methyltransferase